jgi:transcriptional regulator with XRE-family HTH domain
MIVNYESMKQEALESREVRVSAIENSLRHVLATTFERLRKENDLSVHDLAKLIGTSTSQVQRLLHIEQGGSLTLETICRAADALGIEVQIGLVSKMPTALPPKTLPLPSPSVESTSHAKYENLIRCPSCGRWVQTLASGHCPNCVVAQNQRAWVARATWMAEHAPRTKSG